MFLSNPKNLLIGAGVLLLAGIGAAAWIHNDESRPVPTPAAAIDTNAIQPAQASYAVSPASGPPASSGDGYYPSIQPPVYINQPSPVQQEPVANREPNGQYVQGQYTNEGRETWHSRRVRHHGRSKKHSIEIVAGTAAAGAAIGAIAGGGPGAAIGAITGAGAGFTYDRLTHNH